MVKFLADTPPCLGGEDKWETFSNENNHFVKVRLLLLQPFS